ncbi:hypothetical protein DFH09DRAFT_1093669 [Mycena vulgaris]|nr:hypothetical protein DFH09DRAFT_1093669 [Mycena vulgaris]
MFMQQQCNFAVEWLGYWRTPKTFGDRIKTTARVFDVTKTYYTGITVVLCSNLKKHGGGDIHAAAIFWCRRVAVLLPQSERLGDNFREKDCLSSWGQEKVVNVAPVSKHIDGIEYARH